MLQREIDLTAFQSDEFQNLVTNSYLLHEMLNMNLIYSILVWCTYFRLYGALENTIEEIYVELSVHIKNVILCATHAVSSISRGADIKAIWGWQVLVSRPELCLFSLTLQRKLFFERSFLLNQVWLATIVSTAINWIRIISKTFIFNHQKGLMI